MAAVKLDPCDDAGYGMVGLMPDALAHDERLQPVLRAMLDGLESASSARIYRHDVGVLLTFCEQRRIDPLTARRADLLGYAATLRDRGLAPDSRRRMLSVARRFYEEAAEQGLALGPNPAARLPRIRSDPAPAAAALTNSEVADLLAYLAARRDAAASPLAMARAERDRFLILTGLLLALRAAELAGLSRGDVSRAGEYDIVQVRGKGGARAAVKLNQTWLAALAEFEMALAAVDLRLQPTAALFPRLRPPRPLSALSTRSISRIADRALAGVGRRERRSAAHLLRKTSITLVYEASHDVLLAQRQGRHRRVDTTVNHYIDPADRLAESGIDYLDLRVKR